MAQRNASYSVTLLANRNPLANALCNQWLILLISKHSPIRIKKESLVLGLWKKIFKWAQVQGSKFQNSWGFSSTVRDTFSLTCYLKIQIFIQLIFLMVFCSTLRKRHSKITIPFHWKLFQHLGKGFNSTSCRIRCRFAFLTVHSTVTGLLNLSNSIFVAGNELLRRSFCNTVLLKHTDASRVQWTTLISKSALGHHNKRVSQILKIPEIFLKCTPVSQFFRIAQQNLERGWARCRPPCYCPRLAPSPSPRRQGVDWWSCWAPGAHWVPPPHWSWSDKGWNSEG